MNHASCVMFKKSWPNLNSQSFWYFTRVIDFFAYDVVLFQNNLLQRLFFITESPVCLS
jgi:hypothetical protein